MITFAHIIEGQTLRVGHLVIGSGAGGATTARLLAEAGEDVLILEEGEAADTADFAGSQVDLMGRLYRSGGMTPIMGRPTIAFGEGCCVGGSTVINGALLWRPPPAMLTRWGQVHGLADVDGAAMQSRFDWLERQLAVSPQDDPDANEASRRIGAAALGLDWRSEAAPRGQISCRNSNRCPTGCPTGAKQSMLVSFLPAAGRAGAKVLAGVRAERLLTRKGRAVGVVARTSGGDAIRVMAETVWICGGPMQSPYILQNSGIPAGGGLSLHLNLKVVALFHDDLAPHRGTIMTRQVKQFGDGGILIGGSNFDPIYLAATLSSHGADVIDAVMAQWGKASIFVGQVKASGRGKVGRLPFGGRPLPRYGVTAGDQAALRETLERMAELLFAAGAHTLYLPIAGSPPATTPDAVSRIVQSANMADFDLLSVHAMSSCFGVVDPFGQVRGLDNVMVNDASILPEATGINPQLTIMAMAMRNAHHHLERLRR